MTRDYTPVQETSLLQTDTFGTGEQVNNNNKSCWVTVTNIPPCR